MRSADLIQRLEDQPFRPFRIHLSDGTELEIPDAGMVIVGPTTAVIPSRYGKDDEGHRLALHWRTVNLLHIVQFSELDEPRNGKHGKNRRRKS